MRSKKNIEQAILSNNEKLNVLSTISNASIILKEGKNNNETLKKLVTCIPNGWEHSESACARIVFDNNVFLSSDFSETNYAQTQSFITNNNKSGRIEVYYKQEFPTLQEGPFLYEERFLVNKLAELITKYLNRNEEDGENEITDVTDITKSELESCEISNKHLLQKFLNKSNQDRDIYHDLMPFKVKEILLIATLYDAYSIEKEGRFSEHVLGEYQQLNLTSMPRITGVSSNEEALEQMNSKHFDLVLIMVGSDKVSPIKTSKNIYSEFPYIPIFLLLNNNSDIAYFDNTVSKLPSIERLFVWNGESKVFFAIIKHVEDKINANNDTKVGLIRVILLVEDSPIFYTRYLQILYHILLQQTKRVIDDVSTDELYKVLRMRARPKILLASNYEEAIDIYSRYKEFMLCLITDVKFNKNDRRDSKAGYKLAKYIKNDSKDLPLIIQSSNSDNKKLAVELNAHFINKNSETLRQDFRNFIVNFLGFGDFVFRDINDNPIAVAKSLKEFEDKLNTISDESFLYHARKNHFSLWLMARGEIRVAKIINPQKVSDFKSALEIRKYLINVIQDYRNEKKRGKIIPFHESAILDDKNILSLSSGNLGGKGRGLAFINSLIQDFDFSKYVPNINIKAPQTAVIGTDEFELFLENNNLEERLLHEDNYEIIKQWFLNGNLSDELINKLYQILDKSHQPIAVRSSGLFEDSLMQPFAGIFATYILPNKDPDINVRLKQITDAIKLVYASVFSNEARSYIKAINYKIEEEKMAIIIQEVVGHKFGDYYYPHLSGVAQSYNYYPFGHIKPEDGVANIAIGLGKYVKKKKKTFRFSPAYPTLDNNSAKDQFKNSQIDFYAVDLEKKNIDLLEGEMAGLKRLEIYDAENHGTLNHCVSTFDNHNLTITPGLAKQGPRVVNFANILKYNYIPLAKTIEVVIDVVKEALGSSVEIEFAVDLKKDKDYKSSFYLLQIKPLLGNAQEYNIKPKEINDKNIILYSKNGMGNGKINNITDVIFVDNDIFNKTKTEQMAQEIAELNNLMIKENRKYILIGPGRWGTQDRWIGIPVTWAQISNAKLIVETNLEQFPLNASSGSHFFHNVTSMNVGYCSIMQDSNEGFFNWDILKQQQLINKTDHFLHVRFDKPLTIKMDGKKRITLVSKAKE